MVLSNYRSPREIGQLEDKQPLSFHAWLQIGNNFQDLLKQIHLETLIAISLKLIRPERLHQPV